MRKKLLSIIVSTAIIFAGLGPNTAIVQNVKTAEAAENSSVESAYFWDFDHQTGKNILNTGTAADGDAVLCGTADTEEDVISIGEKNYKKAGNKVLVLSGGSKGSSYADLPSNLYEGITAQTGFSYSFWIKPDTSVGSYSRVISSTDKGSENEFAFAPYAADKVWNVLFDNTNTVYAPMPTEIEKNVWSFVTFTVSREEVVFYVNGEEAGTVYHANLGKRLGSIETLVNNALGKTCSVWTDPDAKVKLDDVCLYKKALTSKEAADIAKAQGFDVTISNNTEAGGENELTDGTKVTDTELAVSKGDITAKIKEDKETGRFYITAARGGQVLLDASQLGIKTSVDLTQNLSYVEGSSKISDGKDEYKLTTGAKREIQDEYKELSFDLKTKDGDSAITVLVRVYEDGAAYRYQWKGSRGETETIQGEASEFVLPADSYIWAGYDAAGNYEYEYQKLKMSSVKAATATYSVPLLANSGEKWMLFTEADVFSREDTYCASQFSTTAGTRNLKFTFGRGSGKSITMTYDDAGIMRTPWRVAIMEDNLNDLVNATITSSLNPAPDEELYKDCESWIKTGIVAWSWWSEAGDDPIEFDQQKDYIDFAAENGWEYVCLDFGWCLWKDYKSKVRELVEYGAGKGVGILLWYGVNNDNHSGSKDAEGNPAYPKYSLRTKEQVEEQFAWCESVGVRGVKVDYYENDDKKTMTLMYECATIAARHKINVLFHGCTAPRGEIRTFPNVLGYEAVRGSEYYKWNVGPSISNCLTYVYNRNVVGGMDFTPVGTQIDQLPVTAGFQLAQVIAYQTGLQNIASSVYKLEGYKGLSMINDVPAQWDETRLLDGYPGEKTVIARRNGQNWYVAAMTADSGMENIPLDFLADGEYKAYIYQDNAQGTDVQVEVQNVTKNSVLTLSLAENGGAAVRISKEEMKTATAYDEYTYYEAELPENELGGNAVVGTNQFASGMKQIINLGQIASNTLTFTNITVPEDGVYEMRLYYACGVERRVIYSVNGEEEIRSGKLNAGVNTLAMERFYVRLKKGTNRISFGNNRAKAPNIDRIAISNTTVNETPTVTDLTDDGEQISDGVQYEYTIYGISDAVVQGGAKKEGNAIGWLGQSESSIVKYTVNVKETGNYKLQINYFAGESRKVYVSANGGEKVYYECPSTGSYTIDSSESIYVDVSLKEGDNVIQLGNATAWCPNIVSIGVSKTVVEKSQEQDAVAAPKTITVKAKGYILSHISLVKGKKVKFSVSVSPKNANQKVFFSSSNPSVATVSRSGVVNAKKAGKTKITISTQNGKKKKTVVIQVQKSKIANKKLELKKAKATLSRKKQTAQIVVKTLTSKATDSIIYKVVSGKKYIKVDAYGKVTLTKNLTGKKTAKVLVRCGKAEKTFTVLLQH